MTLLVCTGCDRPHTPEDSERLRLAIRDEVHAWPLDDYPFEIFTQAQRRSLERRGITTVGGLAALGDGLLELPGFGPVTVAHLREMTRVVIGLVMEHRSLGNASHATA